jgi:hypothetical protein
LSCTWKQTRTTEKFVLVNVDKKNNNN